MRKRTYVTMIFLGAALIAAGLGLRYLRWRLSSEQLCKLLTAEFEEAVEGRLTVGSASLDAGGVLRADYVSVRVPDAREPMLRCRSVVAELDMGQLLRLRPVVRRITLVEPTLQLSYSPTERRWNLEDLRAKTGGGAPAEAGHAAGASLHVEGATVVLTDPALFKDAGSRRYEGVWLDAVAERGQPAGWRLDGGVSRGPLAGTRFWGHVRLGRPAELRVSFAADELQVDEPFWHFIPCGGNVWKGFRPEGAVSTTGTVRSGPEGKLDYAVEVRAHGATMHTRYVPAPIERASGTVLISNDDVQVQDMVGTIPPSYLTGLPGDAPPARVRVNAIDYHKGGGRYEIEVADIPLSRSTMAFIPDVGNELWRRLKPEGRCRLSLILNQKARRAPLEVQARAEVTNATLRPPELPLPVREVNGTILVSNDSVALRGMHGTVEQAAPGRTALSIARVEVDGVIGLRNGMTDLDLRLRNLRTDEPLVRAIPRHGAGIWETTHIETVLDGDVQLRQRSAEEPMSYAARLGLNGGRARLSFWPVPLRDLSGVIRLDGPRLLVEHLSARLDLTDGDAELPRDVNHIEAEGSVDLEREAGEFDLVGRNLTLGERLVTSIPSVGPAIWNETHAEGIGSFAGALSYDKGAERPVRCLLEARLHDVRISPRVLPVPAEALSGDLFISERRTVSDDLSGVTCSGQFRSSFVAFYGVEGELPSYSATVDLRNLDLAELAGYLKGKPTQARGLLSGSMDLGGLLDGGMSLTAKGTVSLTEGRLWRTPFLAGLLSVLHLKLPGDDTGSQTGTLSFTQTGKATRVHEFELTGSGLALNGFGTGDLDGNINLTMVVAGAPENGRGIPIVSNVVGWAVSGLERELFRVEVTGTLDEPHFSPKPLTRIMWPLTSLRTIVTSPIFGPPSQGAAAP